MAEHNPNSHDPLAIPRWWKWFTLAILFALGLLALAVVAWLIRGPIGTSCQSEAHLSDLCDPYLPGVPGKEGSH